MTMIKILEAPTQNERHKFVSFPNLNGSHQFNLDNYDIRIYYHKPIVKEFMVIYSYVIVI